jgi:hypothetical protein
LASPWLAGVNPRRDLLRERRRIGSGKLALFIGEPAVVRPDNWDPLVHKAFDRVLTWNDDLVDGTRYFKFRQPIPSSYPRLAAPPFAQRGLLANISGNKFSTHPDELYSSRRETIRYFEKTHAADFGLFGTGWNLPGEDETPYSSYRGTVQNKWDIYRQYRFGLCYENMRNAPGYVTEKLFDCARAGSVPVYWGAPNVTKYVDHDVFIDRTAFSSNAELARFLADMSEAEYSGYVEAALDYFRTDRFAAFLPPTFAKTVIEVTQLQGDHDG